MARSEWYCCDEKLGGYSCVRHRVTKELCLASSRGEIWEYGSGKYSVMVCMGPTRNRISKLLRQRVNGRYLKGEEVVFTFEESLLPEIVELMGIPKTRPKQIREMEARRTLGVSHCGQSVAVNS